MKNVLVFCVLFCNTGSPVHSVLLILVIQFVFSGNLILLYSFSSRRLWATLGQEVLLTFYFFIYSGYQKLHTDEVTNVYMAVMYTLGLSCSAFGALFNVIDRKKYDWIPREAWPSK